MATMKWMAMRRVGVLVIALATPMTLAQGPSSLAEENEQLKERVAELESQLEMARTRIDALDEEVQRLRKQLADARKGGGGAGGGTAPRDLSASPMASPSILYDHLKQQYAEAFEDVTLDTRADQVRHRREVGTWVRDMQRSLNRSVSWTIRVTDRSAARSRQPLIQFEVIDPATGEALGEAMGIVFPSRFARMIAADSTQELWRLEGEFSAQPTLNTKRLEEGDDAEAPPFIGAFAEYGFELAIQSFEPAL